MNRIWVTNTGECSDGIAAMRHAFQPDHVINSGDAMVAHHMLQINRVW